MEKEINNKKLGDPVMVGGIRLKSNVLMSPLDGYTCFPFRLMAERLGAGSAYTEMVSSDGLKYDDRATSKPSLSARIIHRYTAFRRSIEGIRVSPIRKEVTRSDASGRFSLK